MRRGEPSQREGDLGTPSDVGGMGAALSFRVLEGTGHANSPRCHKPEALPWSKIKMKDDGKVLKTHEMSYAQGKNVRFGDFFL